MARMPRTLVALLAVAAGAIGTDAQAAPQPGLPADWQRGVNLTSWSPDAYAQPTSDSSLADLQGTGTTHVAIVVTWYMDTGTSSTVVRSNTKTPTDASVEHAIARARSLGYRVMLKPHVDVHDGTFRGLIAPASRAAWYASYRAMIAHYADMAQRTGVDLFVVGTELSTMATDEGEWREIIRDVRTRFGGSLTFGANWIAGAQDIRFWRDLDYIGVDAYMPLSDGNPNPTVEELEQAWNDRGYVRQLDALRREQGRPVIFTEAGYQSRVGTAVSPWWLTEGQIAEEPQQRAYEAAFRVWSRVPWFKGIYWWDWSADGYNYLPDDAWHRFAGKLAGETVRTWNTAPPITLPPDEPPAPPPPPPAPPPSPPTTGTDGAPLRRLALDVYVGGRRQRRLRFRIESGVPRTCTARVKLRLYRWSRSRRHWKHRLSVMSSPRDARVYVASLSQLAAGKYRARGVLTGRDCSVRARSKARRFVVTRHAERRAKRRARRQARAASRV